MKVNDVIAEYRSYKCSSYIPFSMIVKANIRDSEDKEVATYTYDAYGNKLSATGDLAKAKPIRYVGYYYDEETKNYYLQARYYTLRTPNLRVSFSFLNPSKSFYKRF